MTVTEGTNAPNRGAGRRRFAVRSLVVVVAVAAWGWYARGELENATSQRDPVSSFLLAVTVVLLSSHLLGALFTRLRQPSVVGQIIGGLLLGPSVLGLLWPAGQEWLFPAGVRTGINLAAQLGIIVFMFLVGCELRLDSIRSGRRTVGLVAVGSIGIPFLGGLAIAVAFRSMLQGSANSGLGDLLFVGLAISITAVPVLARVLVDLQMERTPLGNLAMCTAAVGDGVAWAALTVLLAATASGGKNLMAMLAAGAAGVGLLLFLLVVVRPALAALVDRLERQHAGRALLTPTLICGAIALAAATQGIGLHPVIGAFMFGAILPRDRPIIDRVQDDVRGFVLTILLPLFFAGVGLTVSIGLLRDLSHWLVLVTIVIVASASKYLGATSGALLGGLPTGDALRVGALMNCRGVTELVVASIGLQYDLINTLAFTILVLMALITTAATGPTMVWLGRRLT